jgi:predicted polyphosphate/ATP-dependent NAD kinase
MQLIEGRQARIVVTVIGGQGFIFGRGNQPLSPRVIRAVGLDNLVIVASAGKLAALPGSRLLVDTGDDELDRALAGYRAVITGANSQAICRVCAADAAS